jgi:hypothetical protein
MRAICRLFFILSCIFTFSSYASAANSTDVQGAFDGEELKKFCQELPLLLAPMNTVEKDRFFITTIMDYPHSVLPQSVIGGGQASLPPKRIAYMLNHIVLAGIIEDMGGFGEGQLEFLKNQKEIVKNKAGMQPDDRKRILVELDDNIRHLENLILQTKSIPKSELVILWQEKDTLNRLLRGQIPIHKKMSEKQ